MESLIVLASVTSAAFMAGVLWIIQVVHYPLLREVPVKSIVEISHRHQSLIIRVVGPVMVIEAASSALAFLVVPSDALPIAFISFCFLAVAVSVTLFQAVPLHAKIGRGESELIPKLIKVNWIRTAAWSIRIPLGALLVNQTLG
ncbi:MAG: hypothetical protein ACJ05G_10535 [Actinomycetota bacterium]|nr:hypothetical protein [Acidimicrobiales bacterium]